MHGTMSFLERLRNAGITPNDSEELRLQKALLVLASGLVSVAAIGWLLIYWALGPKLSTTLPFVLQVLVAANLLIYAASGNFAVFRFSQLAIFLFFPFIAQWALGNFVTASGVILWGLLAPVGALLCAGPRESVPWFAAYVFLTLLTGTFDFLLADYLVAAPSPVPLKASMAFFTLNFATISTIVWLLMRFAMRAESWKTRIVSCISSRSAPSACCSTSCLTRSRSASKTMTAPSRMASLKSR